MEVLSVIKWQWGSAVIIFALIGAVLVNVILEEIFTKRLKKQVPWLRKRIFVLLGALIGGIFGGLFQATIVLH